MRNGSMLAVAAFGFMALPAFAGLPKGISWAEPAPGLDYGRIYYYVPESLDLSARPGLFIFMHGGGAEVNSQPEKYLSPTNGWLRPHIDALPCITVAATAPRGRGDHWRWNHPDAEKEILAIIEDADAKVGIDRDRVFLGGQSMGGFGAYHLGPVLADRLAGVWAAAGAWCTADFRAMRGTPMFIQHGIFDCAPGYSNEPETRKQYQTGYSFARAAHEVMERDGVEHVFSPYRGGHGLKYPEAQESTRRFVRWASARRRQPYAPATTVVTPCGSEKPCFVRKTRVRWLEVTATIPGTVELDTVELSDYEPAADWAAFEAQTYRLAKKRLAGFRLEAFNRGDNRFEVRAENVTGFRIHLAAPMGDLGRPFEVDAGALGRRTLTAVPETGDRDYCAYVDFAAAERPAAAPQTVVVRPKPTGDVLDNPGMGIVIYRHDGGLNAYEPTLSPSETFDWFPGVNVTCLRLPWSALVPEAGDSRWDLVDTYVRTWVAKGRRFALGFTGGKPSDRFFAELSARYAGERALAFVQVDGADDRTKWQRALPDVPIKTLDGEAPVLHQLENCKGAVLPLNWKKASVLDEIERTRTSYCGISGFPEICHRNNEMLFLAVARRIGYRFELRELAFPDVIAAGEPVRISSEWVNVGVSACPDPAYVTYSLLDDAGDVAWSWTDGKFDLRTLEPKLEGTEHAAKVASLCRFGYDCPPPAAGDAVAEKAAELFYLDAGHPIPLLKPGSYTLAVSVGRADGRPEIALPLADGRGRTYPVGKVTVVASAPVSKDVGISAATEMPPPADAPYRDSGLAVEKRIDDLLPRLTPEEKSQLIHTTVTGVTFGGIPRIGLKAFRMLGSGTGPRATDRPGVTAFPAPIAHAAAFDRALAFEIGRAMGAETRAVYPRDEATGTDVCRALAGPGANIARTPLGGRNFEYLGEDPRLAGEIAAAWTLGLQSVHVAPCMKHYCFNDQEYARISINVECDDRAAREIYIRPFEIAARKADPWSFMNAYNKYRGVWTSHSAELNDILGREYGATGAFIPDWGGTHGMPKAINGGTSIQSGTARDARRDAEERRLLAEGKIDADRYDDAVRRALRLYFRVGAFDADSPAEQALQSACEKALRSSVHRELARRAAEESVVLLKNDGLLPFEKANARVAVLGPYAETRHFMHAGDTRLGLFGGAGAVKAAREITPLEGFRAVFGAANVVTGTNVVELAREADLVVYCGGIDHLYESEAGGSGHVEPNDRRDLYLRAFGGRIQEDEIRAIAAVNGNVVVALAGGSAMSVEEWHGRVGAIVLTWYAGEFGGEVLARTVRGEVNPSGRLPVTFGKTLHDWPSIRFGRRSYPGEYDLAAEAVTTGQNGGWTRKPPEEVYLDSIWVGYRGFDRFGTGVRYPFGHGLSYTTFAVSQGAVSASGDVRTVPVTVANAGTRAGRHAILLWASKPAQADAEMPKRELVDFASVELKPGESKTIDFKVGFEDLKYWSVTAKAWKMPVGTVVFHAE